MLSVANGAPILYVAKELEGQKHVDADVEMEQFLKVYTGTFHNELQREADPKLQFASKIHTRVSLPWLGPRCYFVHEKTDRGGKMIHRLRVASISHAIPDSDDVNVVFVSEHYQFTDQVCFLTRSGDSAHTGQKGFDAYPAAHRAADDY